MTRRTPRPGSLLLALLPFADAATRDLPLKRLLRLALFQVSVGMAAVLLHGTLNRVLIVELGAPAWLVALMVALPLTFAPLRALIGFRSDHHRSFLGWRRGPYIWFGSLLQFGGLAIMPFALLLLSGSPADTPYLAGCAGAACAYLLVGAGMHTTQTAGLALATDLAPEGARPRVVALLYVAQLVGMLASAVALGALLADFSELRLIQVVQGAALATMAFNLAALWRQEARDPTRTDPRRAPPRFAPAWRALTRTPGARRLFVAVGLGSAGFAMQDVLLEPYAATTLGMSVAATTALTALWAGGALAGFAASARGFATGDPHRLAGFGALIGVAGLGSVLLAGPLAEPVLLGLGAGGLGFGGGLFAVGALLAAMALGEGDRAGLALGAFGAVQATCSGLAIALGAGLRDLTSAAAEGGAFGEPLRSPATGYALVFQIEIALLFAAIAAIGPLARHAATRTNASFGLQEFPR